MIKNLTRKTILAKRYKICKSLLSRGFGLMFSKKRILVFVFDKEKISALHMFFVFFPIDALFLDANKIVVEIKENLKPFSLYMPKKKAKYIIELPKTKKLDAKVGDRIDF
jgi:hypothetical protein